MQASQALLTKVYPQPQLAILLTKVYPQAQLALYSSTR